MIGLAGYLVQLFLKTDINQHNLSAILIVILGLMAVAEYISYRIQSAFYWLAAGFICSVISYWLPTLANCLFLVIITLYSLKLFYVISRHLIQPYNKLFSQQPSPKTHLLLFLSPLAQHYRKTKDGTDFPLLNEIQNNASEWEIMDTNMKSYNPIINWEMPFRAIYSQLFPASGHPSKLQQVIVALSAPSTDKNGKALEGSAAMITEFVESLQALLKLWKFNQPLQLKLLIMCENTSDKKFTLCEFSASGDYKKRGINSANFEDTSAAVFFAVHTLIQQQVTESDIVIDITGWQKHTSVAGALVATVTDVHNQYIDTNSKEVTNYDFTFNDFTKLT
ncbi:MAG TPA: hypothetical protein VIN66_04295 [Rheinheimera sp.]|uniref:hypothetical protein n=1 Tax=Rheinheimera sp. TaxID=1869214 RepID=UPI002F935C69